MHRQLLRSVGANLPLFDTMSTECITAEYAHQLETAVWGLWEVQKRQLSQCLISSDVEATDEEEYVPELVCEDWYSCQKPAYEEKGDHGPSVWDTSLAKVALREAATGLGAAALCVGMIGAVWMSMDGIAAVPRLPVLNSMPRLHR